MPDPQIQYCTTSDGVSIPYYAMGEGPPLVTTSSFAFYHSLLARSAAENRRLEEAFARRHKNVRYDGRGTGLSQRESPDFSLAARLLDLEAVVDHLRLERFILIGTFFGGFAAVAYAVRHPDRVTHLILIGAMASGREWNENPYMRSRAGLRPTKESWEFYTESLANWDLRFEDRGPGDERVKERAALLRSFIEPEALAALRDAYLEIDVTDLLPQVSAPTLVLRSDLQALATSSQKLASRISGARLVVFKLRTGFGHEEAALPAIEEFLGDAAPADEAAPAPAAPAQPDLPHGTAVILFTDIVDSTPLTEQLGDAAFRERATALDTALRDAIRASGGTPVEGRLVGDGLMAVFTSARQAIDAALRCAADSAPSGLQLHLGIHAGDVIHTSDNVYGGAVNIASRISGLSAPSEVLVSRTVRDLARTSSGVQFEDRGEHALKGIAEPQHLFAVRAREDA